MALILTPGQLSNRSEFYHQLGQLTAAGVPLVGSLEMLRKNPPAASYRAPLTQIIECLGKGENFTESLKRLGLWVPSFDIALIAAGEHSGRIDAVFKLLGNYYADRARLLRVVITDLLYPMFVFHVMVFLFPLIKVFNGGTWLRFSLQTLGVLIPLYVVVIALIFAAQGRRGATWRALTERVLARVPALGTARQYLALARLAAALEALINAGVTIIEAWEMAAAACGSPAIQRAVRAWRPAVLGGVTPSEAVSGSSQFPELFRNLYHSGEISGQLDDSLKRLHMYYQEEGTRKLHLLAQWVPRFIYLMIALTVAYKVVGFYTGYFKQVQDAGGF